MTHDAYKYCRRCGASLPSDSTFCESCRTSVEKPSPPPRPDFEMPPEPVSDTPGKSQYYEPVTEHLPDASVAPRPQRAITMGWEILMQDIVGGILVAFVFAIALTMIGFVTLGVGFLLSPIFLIGLLGWAELRRQGGPSEIGALFTTTFKNFGAAILWWLTGLAITFVFSLPIIWLELVSIMGIIPTTSALQSILVGIAQVTSFALYPILFSLLGLMAYAIARGETYKWSISWAFRRVTSKLFHWWWAGFLIFLTALLGCLICSFGLLITLPLAALAWTVMASDSGEEV